MPIGPSGTSGGGPTLLFSSVLGSPAASIDSGAGGFSTGFTILWVYAVVRSATAAGLDTLLINFNNDSAAHYDFEHMTASNATATAAAVAANANLTGNVAAASALTSTPGVLDMVIPAYAATTFNKAGRYTVGTGDSTAANGYTRTVNFTWRSTAAINRVALTLNSAANFATGSAMYVYAT